MNTSTMLVVFSLLTNGVLAVLIFSPRTVKAPAATASDHSVTAQGNTPASSVTGTSRQQVGELSDGAYVTRLRAAGMPADMIRELVYARIGERYRARRAAVLPEPKDEYWRYGGRPTPETPEQRAQLRELNKALEAEVRAVLGDGPESLGLYERRLRDQMTGYLSNEKVQQVEAIRKDYDELAAQIRERSKGMILKADREQLRLLEHERRKDLEALLTPEELLEYDLRASPTAGNVRNRLTYFEPTEEEYRQLTKLQLEFDRQYGLNNLSGAEADRRKAAEKDLLERVKATLTPDRFADYKVTIDGMFSETSRFVSAYDLDPGIAKEIVALKQSTWARIEELNTDSVSPEQRAATMAELQKQIDTEMTARLGADIYANYKKSGATWWMARLNPTPASRPRS